MKKMGFIILIFTSFLLLFSCGKEKLTPLVSAKTVNQLRNDEPIHFTYSISPTQIDEFARGAGKFPIFGKLFQGIAFVLANSTISSKGGMELNLDPVDIDLSDLENIDFNYIDWVRLDYMVASLDNAKKRDSLEFIDKIEVYAILEHNLANNPPNDEGMTRLVFYDTKMHTLGCDGKCLDLRVEKLDWKELLRMNPKVKLLPKITIKEVPQSSMALAGSVSFSIKFNLGF
ncbi:MAG: hypothetical protein K2Q18_03715 [Bdellovibrionales bacterium]|nr:hypothetical protein [Bdellovibrionales bacterium]